jgi:hypothetical protein
MVEAGLVLNDSPNAHVGTTPEGDLIVVLPIEGDRCFQVSDDLVLFNQQPDLRNSIAEAARSAAAMEGIAKSLSDSAATAQQRLGLMGQCWQRTTALLTTRPHISPTIVRYCMSFS